LVGIDLQNAGRRKHGLRMHVMIGGAHGLLPAGHSTTRELAELYFGLGIERDPQGIGILRGLRMHLPQVVEDGVGLGNFF
jgi:hypothetical protein